jgi:glycine cleavage system aminomethyltransferase T
MHEFEIAIRTGAGSFELFDTIETVALYGDIRQEIATIRTSVALSALNYVTMIVVEGPDAKTFLDRICPRFLTFNPTRMKQTLFIDSDSRIIADVYIGRDKDSYLLLCRGIEKKELTKWLYSHKFESETVSLREMNATHTLITVNGPFSWELMADVYDPEIIGIPYLSFYRPDNDTIVMRAGDTGEYGYFICVTLEKATDLWNHLLNEGKRFNIVCAGSKALHYCMLENNFFNIYKEGRFEATVAELQIQWRVSYRKLHQFSDMINTMRAKPLVVRLTAIASAYPLNEGMSLFCEETNKTIGTVVNAGLFYSGSGYCGLAMITMPYAVSGFGYFFTVSNAIKKPVRSVSLPFVNNRSLYIDPQLHSYDERMSIHFPAQSGVSGFSQEGL